MDSIKEYWEYILVFLFGGGGGFVWKYLDGRKKNRFDIVKELQQEVDRLQKRLDKADEDYGKLNEKYIELIKQHTKLIENNGL